MRIFSEILKEGNRDSTAILKSEITKYHNKLSKKIPDICNKILYITNKYDLNSKEVLEEIRYANLSGLNNIAKALGISVDKLKDLQDMLKSIKNEIKLLPQYQTKEEREALLNGSIGVEDILLDLDTDKGRNRVATQYAPLVYKIVSKYVNSCSLDKAELISAGLVGLTNAMNTYRKDYKADKTLNIADEDKKEFEKVKNLSFKTYAAYCIKYQILSDIAEYSRTVKMSNYYANKLKDSGKSTNTSFSIDTNIDGEEIDIDRIGELGEMPDYDMSEWGKDNEKLIKELHNKMKNKFSDRDINIFFRYFGLNNYKKEKGKDIAKDLHISPGLVTVIVTKMIDFLKKDKNMLELLSDLRDMYESNLISDIYYQSKSQIIETLLNDETFILLEEVNKFNNKKDFYKFIWNGLNYLEEKDRIFISNCIEKGFEYLDANYRKNKRIIINFLSDLYPTENIAKQSDVYILDKMNELITFKQFFN